MAVIEMRNISVSLDQKPVLRSIDLMIEQGDFMTFLGPSGCGKTTLLRTIAGLQKADTGTILIGGREVANGATDYHLEPSRRGLSLVFQSYALWPHMTVFDNVAFGLQIQKKPKADIQRRVHDALAKMQIPELAKKYPGELSGGQQQRVALARAIVTEPDILLMDEPLSNLDAKLRVEMRSELKRLHEELKTTIIFVTHDQQEAMMLSTKVAVLSEGNIAQLDTPRQLYKRPQTLEIAEFIFSTDTHMNYLPAEAAQQQGDCGLQTPIGFFPLEGMNGQLETGTELIVAVKPEHIRLYEAHLPGSVPVSIESIEQAGAETLLHLQASGTELVMRTLDDPDDVELGRTVYAALRSDQMNIYHKESGRLLEKTYPVQTYSGGLAL
ncbi:ABC transporter ATP-binding protein [Paenibacillus physcomitrellae]|uniref:Sugar ABC transporter ATP-binding protein n=1 Tax=Paenibacillus physcomitrellae TaxID=1619311 RepID=A0ABQ1G138_9BACL|nr:ABC transporter ATP-binding protein [Paenibacillus physcomitrellae]GGA34011.1 sugar ABC transporter ATP-binding protein [Paenibacillus physcomitrellae]